VFPGRGALLSATAPHRSSGWPASVGRRISGIFLHAAFQHKTQARVGRTVARFSLLTPPSFPQGDIRTAHRFESFPGMPDSGGEGHGYGTANIQSEPSIGYPRFQIMRRRGGFGPVHTPITRFAFGISNVSCRDMECHRGPLRLFSRAAGCISTHQYAQLSQLSSAPNRRTVPLPIFRILVAGNDQYRAFS
jgi:hypothetical protein